MRTLDSAFAERLESGVTMLARCWRVTRRDGARFGFTDHDVDLTIDDLVYAAATGLGVEAARAALDGVDAATVAGALSSDGLSDRDLEAGAWDGAAVEIFLVDWSEPTLRTQVFSGRLGAVRRGAAAFVADLEGAASALDRSIGRVFSRFCDAELGDSRCGVAIGEPHFQGVATVLEALDARTATVMGLSAFDAGWFAGGYGAIAGASRLIEAHAREGDVVTLRFADAHGLAVGDSFACVAGCDKSFGTCRSKFANAARFRGFPHMIGVDGVVSGPDRSGPLDGSSRWR